MNCLLLFLFFQTIFGLIFAKCPDGTIPSMSDKSLCFLFVPKKLSFFIAENYCNQQNGGHLVSIHDAFDNALIREGAQQNFTDSTSGEFWIGLDDLKSSEIWEWIDGSPFNFADWDKGEPQIKEGYDCGAVKLEGGQWKTENCDNDKPFVCEIKLSETTFVPPTIPTTTKKSISCPNSWIYYAGFCYVVVDIAATWMDAEQYCFNRGGHLASIHSLHENDFITNLIPFDPNNHVCHQVNFAFIGLYTLSLQKRWIWIEDTPFNYSAWAPGRPGNFTDAFCGIIWNGPPCSSPLETWADEDCSHQPKFFICKRFTHGQGGPKKKCFLRHPKSPKVSFFGTMTKK
uniref:C-type lectin domain-containing protein n=1 Tax=Panagrolaimus superbus TaxID=310955 RepID=A0A914YIS4_9BILA